jgi:hypothetical protein
MWKFSSDMYVRWRRIMVHGREVHAHKIWTHSIRLMARHFSLNQSHPDLSKVLTKMECSTLNTTMAVMSCLLKPGFSRSIRKI